MAEDAALAATEEGAVWLQLATVGVVAAEHGVAYVDAPVLGTKEPAEKGELVVLASGPTELHGGTALALEDARHREAAAAFPARRRRAGLRGVRGATGAARERAGSAAAAVSRRFTER